MLIGAGPHGVTKVNLEIFLCALIAILTTDDGSPPEARSSFVPDVMHLPFRHWRNKRAFLTRSMNYFPIWMPGWSIAAGAGKAGALSRLCAEGRRAGRPDRRVAQAASRCRTGPCPAPTHPRRAPPALGAGAAPQIQGRWQNSTRQLESKVQRTHRPRHHQPAPTPRRLVLGNAHAAFDNRNEKWYLSRRSQLPAWYTSLTA